MAIQYPSAPRIPNPVNPLEYGLAGLMDGIQAGRKGVLNERGVDAAYDIYQNAPGRQPFNMPSLYSLGGGTAMAGVSVPAPGTTTGGSTPSVALTGDSSKIYGDFIGTVKAGGLTNPYGLAAVAATGRAESGYSPGNVHRIWSDPSESGAAGNAGGILSWRAERLAKMQQFAAANGDDPKRPSAATQAKFFLSEDPGLVARLNQAGSVEEAQQLMNNAWRFAGYDRPGGEAARRTAMAKSYYSGEFGRGGAGAAIEAQAPTQVASLEPSAGIPAGEGSALAYSPSGPSPEAGRRVPTPTPRPEDQTFTMASPTAPGSPAPTSAPVQTLDVPSIVSAVTSGQVSGPNITREQFRALMASEQTRDIGMALFQSKVTGDPRAAERAVELGLRLETLNFERQRLAQQDALALDDRAYDRGRDAAADQRAERAANRPVEVGGALIDPATGQELYRAPPKPGFRQATPEEAARYGSPAGQIGPDGRFYPVNPPQGMTVESDGQGGVRVVQGSGVQNRPLTEGQSKDAVYSTRAEGALKLLNRNASLLTGRGNQILGGIPFGIGRDYQDPNYQLAQQAGDEFLQAILRKDTGAAITEQEQALYGNTYIPRPGDSEQLLAQKQQSRQRALEAIKAGMPPAAIVQQELALRRTQEASPSPTGSSQNSITLDPIIVPGIEGMTDEELEAIANGG